MRVVLVDLTRIYHDVVKGLGLDVDYEKLTNILCDGATKIIGFSVTDPRNKAQMKFIQFLKENLKWHDVYEFNAREVDEENNLSKDICFSAGLLTARGHDITLVTGDYIGINIAHYRESFELAYFSGCLDRRWMRHLRSIDFTDLHRLIDPSENANSVCFEELP